jgi:hypothetical protein
VSRPVVGIARARWIAIASPRWAKPASASVGVTGQTRVPPSTCQRYPKTSPRVVDPSAGWNGAVHGRLRTSAPGREPPSGVTPGGGGSRGADARSAIRLQRYAGYTFCEDARRIRVVGKEQERGRSGATVCDR